jgi:hypothetical protein
MRLARGPAEQLQHLIGREGGDEQIVAELAVALTPADGETADGAGVVGRLLGDDPADLPLGVCVIIEPLLDGLRPDVGTLAR